KVGRVELHGFRDCEKACVTDGGGELEDIPDGSAGSDKKPIRSFFHPSAEDAILSLYCNRTGIFELKK
uniref:BTB/POZ domain-containing protein n=1 Tax=Globodera pallida TaxID=36090 RepID=A0A183CII2_GLOPA